MAYSDDNIADYESDFECNDESDHDDNLQEDEDEDGQKSKPPVEFSVLTSEDIRRRVDEAASEIAGLLSVSKSEAVVLLCKHKWDPSQIYNEWFSDEAKTRKNCGLMVPSSDGMETDAAAGQEFFCGMCLDDFDGVSEDDRGASASCGHVFCKTCWRAYASSSVTDGSGCLSLRCPEPKCVASAVGIIETFLTGEERKKYENHVQRSYVESRKNMKWCPSPGCEFVIECEFRDFDATTSHLDVICKCNYGFCLDCSEENHSPSDCALAAKWTLKNSSESENKNWITINTKPCPRCGKPIEKNAGCMHMTCAAPCRFQFCWICLQPYSGHTSCNRYEVSPAKDITREKVKSELKKYTHFHDRWSENDKSRKKAMESMKMFKEVHSEPLSASLWLTDSDLQLITDAWAQVVECRRVLKWSYAYGYYIPDEEAPKRRFFEFRQGDAEACLERLHDLVENEALKHISGAVANVGERAKLKTEAELAELNRREDAARDEFREFKSKVSDAVKNTRKFFNDLVDALAKGLEEVEDEQEKLDRELAKALALADAKEMHDRELENALAQSLADLWTNPAQLMYYLSDSD